MKGHTAHDEYEADSQGPFMGSARQCDLTVGVRPAMGSSSNTKHSSYLQAKAEGRGARTAQGT